MPHVYDPLRLITIGRNNLRTEKRDGHRWYGWGACSKHARNEAFAYVYMSMPPGFYGIGEITEACRI